MKLTGTEWMKDVPNCFLFWNLIFQRFWFEISLLVLIFCESFENLVYGGLGGYGDGDGEYGEDDHGDEDEDGETDV